MSDMEIETTMPDAALETSDRRKGWFATGGVGDYREDGSKRIRGYNTSLQYL